MATINPSGTSLFRKTKPQQIRRSELSGLIEVIEASDSNLIKFGNEISRHPAVLKQLLRAANSSLTGSAVEITEPAHATLFLGSRRVVFLLKTLPPELVEEDMEPTE